MSTTQQRLSAYLRALSEEMTQGDPVAAAKLVAAAKEIDRMAERLEIVTATNGAGERVPFGDGWPDGIECRDATIKLVEDALAKKTEYAGQLRGVLDRLVARFSEMSRFRDRERHPDLMDLLAEARTILLAAPSVAQEQKPQALLIQGGWRQVKVCRTCDKPWGEGHVCAQGEPGCDMPCPKCGNYTNGVSVRCECLAIFSDGAALIAAERARQMAKEGWTPEHDDEHDAGELASAAACYAVNAASFLHPYDGLGVQLNTEGVPELPWWPWDPQWWKPYGPLRDLVRAGALIAAEIDRLQRARGHKGHATGENNG